MNLEEQNKIISERPYTIAVDLDGCLAEFIGWKGIEHIGQLNKSALQMILDKKKLYPDLYVIIHTCRVMDFNGKDIYWESINKVTEWLKNNNVPFNEIWTKRGKPFANEYWDDNAINVKFKI